MSSIQTRIIKAYFPGLPKNPNLTYNTTIAFDEHVIRFTCTNGEIFQIKFKNGIANILPVTNGVILKLYKNIDNIIFFKNSVSSLSTAEKASNKIFLNYIISNTPLSCMSPINTFEQTPNSQISLTTSYSNFEFIKGHKQYPIVLGVPENENTIQVLLILNKPSNEPTNFKETLKKMIESPYEAFDICTENSSAFPSEYDFKIISLCNLPEIVYEQSKKIKIKIYSVFSEQRSLFISVWKDSELFIYKLGFPSNSIYGVEVNYIKHSSVICYQTMNSWLSPTNNLVFNVEVKSDEDFQNDNWFNVFLKNQRLEIKNKTLCLLCDDQRYVFFEGEKILFSSFFNTGSCASVHDFKIKSINYFRFYHNDSYSEQKLNLGINDKILLLVLQFFKHEIGIDSYYYLLNSVYLVSKRNTVRSNELCCQDINHFELLSRIICYIISHLLNKTSYVYVRYYHDNDNYKSYTKEHVDIKADDIDTRWISIFSHYEISSTIIPKLMYYMKCVYENIKIYNDRDNSQIIHVVYSLMLNLLKWNGNNDLTYQYLKFFSDNYSVTFTKEVTIPYQDTYQSIADIPSFLQDYTMFSINNKYVFNQLHNVSVILHQSHHCNLFHTELKESTSSGNDYSFYLSHTPENKRTVMINDNFITTWISIGYDITTIKALNPRISSQILNEISLAKNNPNKYIKKSYPPWWIHKILKWIERPDWSQTWIPSERKGNKVIEGKSTEATSVLTNMLVNTHTSKYESDYYWSKIKFDKDTRITEVNRLWSPSRVLKIESSFLNNHLESTEWELDKFNLVWANISKQYCSCIGNGAFNLGTVKSFPKEILEIKPWNTLALLTHDESTYKLEDNIDLIKEKNFASWCEFHNAVAHSIQLSTENFENKIYIRNWIVFNKTVKPTISNAGFIFGMGLLKQWDSLLQTDIYSYWESRNEWMAIAMLLGLAISKASSMDERLSHTMCWHIAECVPEEWKLKEPLNKQWTSILGLGFLYLKTGSRLITDLLMNQIGKIPRVISGLDLKHFPNYNLCIGFALGLINLGLGTANSYDWNIDDKWMAFINGNDKDEKNEKLINIKHTAPCAYVCLTLSYLQSRNKKIYEMITMPSNWYQIKNVRPFNLYLARLGKNWIDWDCITPSEEWIYDNIPQFIKYLHETSIDDLSENIIYSSKIHLIEFSQISCCYYYSICAGVMSIAFKYLGSCDVNVARIIVNIIENKLWKIKVINDIIIQEQLKFTDDNKCAVNKITWEQCLCICAYAWGIIMSGSGDWEIFKILRIIRKKVDNKDYKNYMPGFISSVNQAIGFLFLGAGGLTFSNSKESIAYIYISVYPSYMRYWDDNEYYLQPLRHWYVLACQNLIFETRDSETNEIIKSKMSVEYMDGTVTEVNTPGNLDKFNSINKLYIKQCEGNYDMEIDRDEIVKNYWSNKENMKTNIAYIKKKISFPKEIALAIKALDINMSERDKVKFQVDSIVDTINNYIKDSEIKGNEITIISNIVIRQVQNIFKGNKWTSQLCKFNLLYIKSTLMILVDYVNQDKIAMFYIINDKLNFWKNAIEEGNCTRFDIFNFFIDKERDVRHEGMLENDMSVVVWKEIREFLYYNINDFYQNKIKEFCWLLLGRNEKNSEFDWVIMQWLHLNRVSLSGFVLIVRELMQVLNQERVNFWTSEDVIWSVIENSKDVGEKINEDNFNYFCGLVDQLRKIG